MVNVKLIKRNEEEICEDLLSIAFSVSDSIKGIPTGGEKLENYKETFLIKYFDHFISIMYLRKNTYFKFLGKIKSFYDMSSINVLLRAALETHMLFYYIYKDCNDPDIIKYRFWNWWREGLITRQKFTVMDEEDIKKKKKEKKEIDIITKRIINTNHYKSLSDKQKKKINTGKKWVFEPRKDLIIKSGFSNYLGNHIYSFLSGYAHSESMSLMQIAEIPSSDDAKKLNTIMITILFMSFALFMDSFISLFPNTDFSLSDNNKDLVETLSYSAKNMRLPTELNP